MDLKREEERAESFTVLKPHLVWDRLYRLAVASVSVYHKEDVEQFCGIQV